MQNPIRTWFQWKVYFSCVNEKVPLPSFIHSDHFLSASSSPLLLLRGAPDTAHILCWNFTQKRHRQLWVKDLSKVPTWWLERESNSWAFGRKAPTLPMHHTHILHFVKDQTTYGINSSAMTRSSSRNSLRGSLSSFFQTKWPWVLLGWWLLRRWLLWLSHTHLRSLSRHSLL